MGMGRAIAVAGGLAFLAAGFAADPAEARPKITTKIKYYQVSGSSAREIHERMSVPGFIFNEDAYANIVGDIDHDWKVSSGGKCNAKTYRPRADFVITLPKLAKGAKLSKKLRRNFNSFANLALRHENKHKAIYISCLAAIERKVHRLGVMPCRAFKSHVTRIVKAEWSRCEQRNNAFDKAESTRVARHPLVRAALAEARNPRRQRTASRPSGRVQSSLGVGNSR